jgi:hypothetical protein
MDGLAQLAYASAGQRELLGVEEGFLARTGGAETKSAVTLQMKL